MTKKDYVLIGEAITNARLAIKTKENNGFYDKEMVIQRNKGIDEAVKFMAEQMLGEDPLNFKYDVFCRNCGWVRLVI